jgi:hypothetical protein
LWVGEGLLIIMWEFWSRGLFSCFPNFIFKVGFSISFFDICLRDSIDLFLSTVYFCNWLYYVQLICWSK